MAAQDKTIYDEIAEEFRLGTYNQGLWLKSVAGAEGDPNKATALYTSERAGNLTAERARIKQKPASTSTASATIFGFIVIGCAVVYWVWGFATNFGKIPLTEVAQHYLNLPATPSGQALASNIIPPAAAPDSTATQPPSSTQPPSATTPSDPFAGVATPVPPPPLGVTFVNQTTTAVAVPPPPLPSSYPPPDQASMNTQRNRAVVLEQIKRAFQIKQAFLFSELPAANQKAIEDAFAAANPGHPRAEAQQAYDSQIRAETGTLKRMATEEDIQNAVRLGIDPNAFIHNGVLDPVAEAGAFAATHTEGATSGGQQ